MAVDISCVSIGISRNYYLYFLFLRILPGIHTSEITSLHWELLLYILNSHSKLNTVEWLQNITSSKR